MDSTKILAADINNLTDARYFAAWGIEWLCFYISKTELNDKGIQKYIEIKEWIEGPKFAARFDEDITTEDRMGFVASVGLDGIIANNLIAKELDLFPTAVKIILETDDLKTLLDSPFETIIYKIENAEKFEELAIDDFEDYELYIDTDIDLRFLKQHKDNLKAIGLVIKGGEEEKVGYKSFDDLDVIFEELEAIQ